MTIEKLVFDKASEGFEGSFEDEGKYYNLSICNFEEHELNEARALAEKVLGWLSVNRDASRQFAATELLETKNEGWLEKDDQPITASTFVEAMQLDGVAAFKEGNIEICFEDGDLFWGHVILISVNENFEFESADIAG